MEENYNLIKTALTAVGAFFTAKFGVVYPLIIALIVVAFLDYISGCIASSFTTKLSSKIGFKGILKKLSYFIAVAVALVVDWLIATITQQLGFELQLPMFVGALVTIWLILNELLSILENINRSGVKTPPFLQKLINALVKTVEDKANITTEKSKEIIINENK